MDKNRKRYYQFVLAGIVCAFAGLIASMFYSPIISSLVFCVGLIFSVLAFRLWFKADRGRKWKKPLVAEIDSLPPEVRSNLLSKYASSGSGRRVRILRLAFLLPSLLLFALSPVFGEGVGFMILFAAGFVWIFIGSWLYNLFARRSLAKFARLQ